MFSKLARDGAKPVKPGGSPHALIVAPTRELAVQITNDAEMLGRHCGLGIHAVYGGVAYQAQLDRLKRGVDVLIGTPGRLIDYYKQKAYSLRSTSVLIVDEADRMFDMGFIDDIRFLIRRLPEPTKRQSCLYSATLSHRVLELAFEHMNNAERVVISEEKVTADNITQVVYHVGQDEKLPLVLGLLEQEKPARALMFVNMRSTASYLSDRLERQGYACGALAGDVDQRKRLKILERFKQNDINILVATDVASRGLHIEAVSHVFNYDLPQDPEDYVHRVGRTARAGASGKAVSLACERYVYSLEAIEEFIGHSIPNEFPEPEMFVKPVPGGPSRRGRKPPEPKGRRSSSKGGRGRATAREEEKPAREAGAESPPGEKRTKRKRRRRRRRSPSGDGPTASAG